MSLYDTEIVTINEKKIQKIKRLYNRKWLHHFKLNELVDA